MNSMKSWTMCFFVRYKTYLVIRILPFKMRMHHHGITVWLIRVVPGFGKELFEPDLERLEPHLQVAMELVPCFAEASIQSVVNGPITYTPDLVPLVGPDLLPNMWIAAGFGWDAYWCSVGLGRRTTGGTYCVVQGGLKVWYFFFFSKARKFYKTA